MCQILGVRKEESKMSPRTLTYAGGLELSGMEYKTEGRVSVWHEEELSFQHMLSVRCS